MAENKNSYIGYVDWGDTFDMLTDEQSGKLIKHFYAYLRDENPVLDDPILKIAFHPIMLQLKRDLKTWESKKEIRSQAGKKGMEKRWNSANKITKDNNVTDVISPITKITVTDTVNVNVNDNVNESVILNTGAHALEKSNLFRAPSIPTFQQVHEAFIRAGGTEKMAERFYDAHSSTEWFIRGSPIKNFVNLIPSFIENWNKNESNKFNGSHAAASKNNYRPSGTGGY